LNPYFSSSDQATAFTHPLLDLKNPL